MAHNEKVAIVDELNNIIGYKLSQHTTKDDIVRIISAWIENSKGEVLMQQRSFAKRLGPGLWTPAVEGTVTANDSYEDTAIREIAEEIGLPEEFALIPTKTIHYSGGDSGDRWVKGYKVTCNWPIERFVIQKEEVEQIKWFDKNEVIRNICSDRVDYPDLAKIWLDLFDLR